MTTSNDSNTVPDAPHAQAAGSQEMHGEHPIGEESHRPQEDEPARDDTVAPDRLVPVTQAIRYRRRAQAAERVLSDAQRQLEELRDRLTQAQQSVAALERRQRIDALLLEEGTIDLDAARLLAERAAESMSEPDATRAVAEVKRQKPYLFRSGDGIAAAFGAMAPRFDDEATPTEQAAQRAAETGDRRDLLAYLRLRRRS